MLRVCEDINDVGLGVASFAESAIDVVFMEDKHCSGYTGYIRAIPGLVAQGSTKRKVINNLIISLKTILLSQLK